MNRGATAPAAQELSRTEFLDGMSRLAAAVHIITTGGPAGRAGFTASAVCSVTDSPPTLLVCVNMRSSSLDMVLRNEVLCVNTLTPAQMDVAQAFASGRPMDERFETGTWETAPSGAPRMTDSLVSFDCKVVSVTEQGSHKVLFCEIRDIGNSCLPTDNALIYFGRTYSEVRAMP